MDKETNLIEHGQKASERMLNLAKMSKGKSEKTFILLSMLTLLLIPIPAIIATVAFTFTGGVLNVVLSLLLLILTIGFISKWSNFCSLKIGLMMGLLLIYDGLIWLELVRLSFNGSPLGILITGVIILSIGFIASLTANFVYFKHLYGTALGIINSEEAHYKNTEL